MIQLLWWRVRQTCSVNYCQMETVVRFHSHKATIVKFCVAVCVCVREEGGIWWKRGRGREREREREREKFKEERASIHQLKHHYTVLPQCYFTYHYPWLSCSHWACQTVGEGKGWAERHSSQDHHKMCSPWEDPWKYKYKVTFMSMVNSLDDSGQDY